jgi:hypothetical protein
MEIKMSNKIFERISNLSMYGYYDPSKDMVIVHFFNEEDNKFDVIAYLKRDMSWDVREVIGESSMLNKDSESITINHNLLGIYEKGSRFDALIREGLEGIAQEIYEDGTNFADKNKLFAILDSNSYDN